MFALTGNASVTESEEKQPMSRFGMHRFLPLVCFLTLALPFAAQGRADTIEVEEQSLPGALRDFSYQTGLQLAYVATLAQGKNSRGTQGRTDPEAALSDILDGTGLKHQYVNRSTVAIGRYYGAARRHSYSRTQAGEPVRPVLLAQFQAVEGEDAEQEDESAPAPAAEDEPMDLGVFTVTGSRLQGGDPTARIYSLTAEDIAARGVSTLEELFRTLPWAFPGLTTQTNMSGAGDAEEFGVLGVGISAINLRGMGAANTLVLFNGRRTAGLGGYQDGTANILNIPLAAIERVDIQLGGGSAVYGSDAVGGVVNLISRNDYQGASVSARNEFSSTGAHSNRAEFVGGHAWRRGNATATLSRSSRKPINNHKIWTTSDYRDRLGPEFDLRSYRIGQPGVVQDICGYPPWTFGCGPRLQLPAGHSGAAAQPDDFTTDIAPWDHVFPQNGEDSTNIAATLNLEHYLTDSFRIHADIMYSSHDAYQEFETLWADYPVPASNAFNPFGRDVNISYWPGAELEAGAIPGAYTESEDEKRDYTLGFLWAFGSGHQLEVNFTRSRADRFVWQISPDLQKREFHDPSRRELLEALASPDPNVALNLFGDGSAQGSGIDALLSNAVGPERGITKVTSYESVLRGQLFSIRGGPVTYAAGGEFRKELVYQATDRYAPDGTLSDVRGPERILGVEQPTRELTAYFAELAIPLVSERNARPGLRSLVLSVQARHDRYKAVGASGGVEILDFDETGDWITSGTPNLVTAAQSATSPRVGLQFMPTDNLTWRAEWTRSFKAPVFSDVFSVVEPTISEIPYTDPYDPDGPAERFLPTVWAGGSNPHIGSEFSDHYSISFDWAPPAWPGLIWTAQWSRIDFGDKIEDGSDLLFEYPHIAFRLPSLVRRDAQGRAIEVFHTKVNIAELASETLETQLQYTFELPWGSLNPAISYIRVLKEFTRITPETDRVRLVGTGRGSDSYKLVGSLTWMMNRFTADMFAYYSPGYTNDRAGYCREVVGRCEIPFDPLPTLNVGALLTVDLTMTYRFDNGLMLRAGGRNVFDRQAPPTLRQGLPYDATRWDARGRVLFLDANWQFDWGAGSGN